MRRAIDIFLILAGLMLCAFILWVMIHLPIM